MRALFSALLAAAVWTLAACAPAAQREPALWRIADGDSEIWLFGSVHMLPADLAWRGPRVDAALAGAEEFVTETDMPGPNSASEYTAYVQAHGFLPAGQTLSSQLSPAEAAQLARVIRTLNLDPVQFQQQRPWYAAIQLSFQDQTRSGQSAEAGVENVLAAEATRQGKRFSSLETLDQQLDVLSGLTPEVERHFLAVTLNEIEQQDTATVAEMDRAWARGDTATLKRLFAEQWRESGDALHEAIILNRNRAWAGEIERRLHGSGRIFIAVGAAHLIGDGSVVDLLRARGIEVEGP